MPYCSSYSPIFFYAGPEMWAEVESFPAITLHFPPSCTHKTPQLKAISNQFKLNYRHKSDWFRIHSIYPPVYGSTSTGFLAYVFCQKWTNCQNKEHSTLPRRQWVTEHIPASPRIVLSSCDSRRGTVKADGILGMTQAFILAGAQAVLTTL